MKSIYNYIALCSLFMCALPALYAQSAALDVESTSQGVLLPRMTKAQRMNINLPAYALIVYQIDDVAGFYYNEGSPTTPTWRRLSTGVSDQPCESRIPIDTLPFTISSSGSYYVVKHLTGAADSNGITITTSNVTLDFNGYTLSSGGGTSGHGVLVSQPIRNLFIHNGQIESWPQNGISAALAQNSSFNHLHLSDNQSDGILIGANNQIDHCASINNLFDGIDAGQNCIIQNSIATSNGDDGIESDGTCIVQMCASHSNSDNGFNVGQGSTLSENVSSQNGDRGFVTNNAVILRGNTATNNTGSGFSVGSACHLNQNISRANTGHGYITGQESFIIENVADNNALAGFYSSADEVRLENNQSTSNGTYGFDIQGPGDCVIIRNTAISNSPTNYIISVGNSVGPIIGSDLSTATNPFSNIGL